MPVIRPITDLRNTKDISELCHSNREPVFITKNGYSDLVIMSIETYDDILKTTAIDAAIMEADAEAELSSGKKLHDEEQSLNIFKKKHNQ